MSQSDSNHNTTSNNDMADSTPSGTGNYELSGDSALSNGTNNHYSKYDAVEPDDMDRMNHFADGDHGPLKVSKESKQSKDSKQSADSKIDQKQSFLDKDPDMAIQPLAPSDVETKENAMKQDLDMDETLEDWQLLKRSTIEGQRCKLVPYTADHVPTYNKWLNDPYIQQMTGTEPYSLSQEYEYQKEWYDDRHKYIFIILDRSRDDAMAGDINLFIQNEEEPQIGELNIMIAEEDSRRKGIATEALQLMLDFARTHFELRLFMAKIQHDNASSIKLFQKVGFKEAEYVETFKEFTFTLSFEEEHSPRASDHDKNTRFHTDNDDTDELVALQDIPTPPRKQMKKPTQNMQNGANGTISNGNALDTVE